MNVANRKAKLTKYEVTVWREVEYSATIKVDARSLEEAQGLAEAYLEHDDHTSWGPGAVTTSWSKAKVVRTPLLSVH